MEAKDTKISYTHPEMVRSPKDMLKGVKVLLDKGEDNWSLAEVIWDKKKRLAVRWNGSFNDQSHSVGTPQSRGLPMWFILPDDKEFFDVLREYNNSI